MLRYWVSLAISLTILLLVSTSAHAAVGTDFDLQGFIDKAVKAGDRRIVVPPGQYRVTPKNAQHLVLRDLQNIQIIADGVEMICTQTTLAMNISNCRNLTLRGLVIDYDPLPFTQGRIVKMSDDKKVHEIELFEGYPPASAAALFKYEIFRPDTRTLRCEDHQLKSLEAIDARHLRLTHAGGSANDAEQVGDLIVIGAQYAPGGSSGHAIVCDNNVNVRLENINLYASNCFGFLETNCDGSTYYRCRIDRRWPENDLVKRADPRLRSLNADAYHSKHAIKGPAIIECVAKFMGDDAVNICGDYHMVTACQGAELRVLAKGRMNAEVGQPVELMAYDGMRLPDAKVVKIEPDGSITDVEKAFLLKQRMDQNIRTRWNAKAYKVTLDRAVELPLGSLLAATNRMGNGFLVQSCDFGSNRSRGILIKASNGKVIDNKLAGSWGEAIKVSPEYWWLESGSSNNVQIAGNVVSDCRTMAIAVYAHGGPGKLAPAGAHSNIAVLNNTVSDSPVPNIYVTSTDGLRIEGNTCAPLPAARPAIRRGAATVEAILTENCTHVTMDKNTVK